MSTVYDVAVVGSRGFLGSAVAAELERRGAHIGRFTKDHPYIVGGSLAAGARAVVWAVGHVTPADPTRGDVAIGDLERLIDAARRSGRAPHIVLLSSGGAVYGPPTHPPYRESDETHPANEYGRIKLAEEQLLADAELPHTVLRVANPYGRSPLSSGGEAFGGQGVVGHWLAAIRRGQPVTVFGDGSAERDFVFIDDAAAAIATAAERAPAGIINIGSGEGTSLARLLEVVTSAVAPSEVRVRREPPRGVDPASAWLDVSRAREALGWRATTTLEVGIARSWAGVNA